MSRSVGFRCWNRRLVLCQPRDNTRQKLNDSVVLSQGGVDSFSSVLVCLATPHCAMSRVRPVDRIGLILNNRKIIDVINVNSKVKYVWSCCVCGLTTTGDYSNLKKEKKNHCGCLGNSHRSGINSSAYKHGKVRSSEWNSWYEMKRRLTDKNHKSYKHYTQILRIDADPCWLASFENFYTDMGPKPDDTFTLERIDPYKGYWPANCRWASKVEQARNKTNTLWCEYSGNKYPLRTVCTMLNLKYNSVYMRIKRGHKDPFFGVTGVSFISITS